MDVGWGSYKYLTHTLPSNYIFLFHIFQHLKGILHALGLLRACLLVVSLEVVLWHRSPHALPNNLYFIFSPVLGCLYKSYPNPQPLRRPLSPYSDCWLYCLFYLITGLVRCFLKISQETIGSDGICPESVV